MTHPYTKLADALENMNAELTGKTGATEFR